MTDMVLPRLLGTREAAEALVSSWRENNQTTSTARVIARSVALATPSFINAFLETLEGQGVDVIELKGASAKFAEDLEGESASHHLSVLAG